MLSCDIQISNTSNLIVLFETDIQYVFILNQIYLVEHTLSKINLMEHVYIENQIYIEND